jgi:hypothetical protein
MLQTKMTEPSVSKWFMSSYCPNNSQIKISNKPQKMLTNLNISIFRVDFFFVDYVRIDNSLEASPIYLTLRAIYLSITNNLFALLHALTVHINKFSATKWEFLSETILQI